MKSNNSSPKFCYAFLPSQELDPTVAELDWKWAREHAETVRDQKNAALGISREDAEKLLAASLFPNRKS
jgi:hypothetical protein